ncbi:16346_t:CDS:2 [Entrophospora sp. SA101]|nr:16346_t:CDS:2 [Entrophospora sp. SA101]
MSSWIITVTYVGGMLVVMSTFSYIWRRRKADRTGYEPWFPEHSTRDIYISLLEQTSPPATELQLKAALLRRAMTDVERVKKLREDKPALLTLVQKGAVGDELWNSFVKAEQEIQTEIMEVSAEANTFKDDWGQTIFQTANEMIHHQKHKEIPEKMKELKEKEEKLYKKREEREKIEIEEKEKREKLRTEKEPKEVILTQVEYYFGDENLGRDTFLNELRNKDPNGWCSLNIIRTFKKMQVYKDLELIVEALRESPELLEVDEAGEHVRRKLPLLMEVPNHVKQSAIWRTIYAKGFGDTSTPSLEKEVKSFFSQYGNAQKIFPRRDNITGNFKAKKVKGMELTFHDTKLLMMMKFDYCEMKCVEKGLDPNTMRKPQNENNRKNLKIKNNSLIQFSSAGENIDRFSIKGIVEQKYAKVSHVQYKAKEPSGIIELMESGADAIVKSMLQDNFTLGGDKLTLKVLDGIEILR